MSKNIRFIILSVVILAALALFFGLNGPEAPKTTSEASAPNDSALLPASQVKPAAIATGPADDFIIGVITGTSDDSVDLTLGLDNIVKRYGLADNNGLIRLATYPDGFIDDMNQTIDIITRFADDPRVKVICVFEGVPGTAEAFARIRAVRPDIVLMVTESHEDFETIATVADLVVNSDFISRGYFIPHTAKALGAESFVHISFPRHMIDENIKLRRDIMAKACEDLGLAFYDQAAPDPRTVFGTDAVELFFAENIPRWLDLYGPKTAFFTTNDDHTKPLIEGVIAHGGFFVEPDFASPFLGFPEALNLDIESLVENPDKAMDHIEEAVVKKGAGARLGTWKESLSYANLAAVTEFARLIALGEVTPSDTVSLLGLYRQTSPDIGWHGSALYTQNQHIVKNVFLILQDTYVFGRGPMGTTSLTVPSVYKEMGQINQPHLASNFQIAVVTGDLNQGAEDILGAWEMIRRLGSASDGGLINHQVYTDDYLDQPGLMSDLIASLADDPLTKVIVVNQAIEGTAEGFRRVKAKRPDIFCLAGEIFEDASVMSDQADLVVIGDFISRGYILPYAAKLMGAKNFVHISFDRHLSLESIALRLNIFREACKDLGLNFYEEIALDPMEGLEAATEFIESSYESWIKKYGVDTVFFTTNDAHTEPLLRRMTQFGGYFVEADIPSPLLGYPGAFDIDIEPFLGRWQEVLAVVEKAVIDAGGSGRMGTWAYPLGFAQTTGLVGFGKLLAEGRTKVSDINTLLECLDIVSPGASWNGSYLTDLVTGKPLRNVFLIYQDVYIFGQGYIETTKIDIPIKYYSINIK
jgi:hypothetical protein